jgi:hypothetical protein
VRTRETGTHAAVVELGGPGPLASSPQLEVSPCPSCPLMFQPQHLTVVSFCSQRQPRITGRSGISIDIRGESFAQGAAVALPPNAVLD